MFPTHASAPPKRPTKPKITHATRKRGRVSGMRTSACEKALAQTVARLVAKVDSMERRFVRLGLAEQPVKQPSYAKGKQWGLPPRSGEVRLQVRDDDWKAKDLRWY